MKKKNYFFLKVLAGLILFIAGLLFLPSQSQAAYKISYDGTSFIVDSLQVNIEWNALGCGHDDLPWFAFNGSIMQYDWYDYCFNFGKEYCCLPVGERPFCRNSGQYDWNCMANYVMSETLRFSANLQIGQNSFEMYSNNNMCDYCGCHWAWGWVCDGVYAKITFANGQVLYTDGSWDGLGRPVIDISHCGYTHYLQSVTCGDCCQTHARKFVTVTVETCSPSCSSCSVYCGEGTQTCTRADCSTYSQSCNTQCCSYSFQNGDIAPKTVNPNSSYNMSCNYGQAGIDCINVTVPSGSCSFTNFTGTTANFSCTAGSAPGTFTGYCKTVTGTASQCCALTNSVGNLTVNSAPSATTIPPTQPNYCVITWPAAILSWNFTDPDAGDTQSAYRIQVDNNSGFLSPEINTGKVISNSNSYATLAGALAWNTTYYWRLKVWDSKGAVSSFISGPAFTTPLHQYPTIDFSWLPQNPAAKESAKFTDGSTVYGGSSKSSWLWTFTDANPSSSTEQDPSVKFLSAASKSATLRVTDSDGFSCEEQRTINVQLPPPDWREIPPF